MDEPLIYLIPLIILLALEIIATSVATAYENARFTRLQSLQSEQGTDVTQALNLLNHRPGVNAGLHTAQIFIRFGIFIFGILLIIPGASANLPVTTAVLVIFLTVLILSFFEFFIGEYIARDPERWAVRLSFISRILLAFFSPLYIIPKAISSRIFPETDHRYSVTEDDLTQILNVGQREGVIEDEEREMISSILTFHDTMAREVMVPRIDMLALQKSTPIPEAIDALLESGFSRVPIFEETIDRITGILYVKDLLRIHREDSDIQQISEIARPVYFVPETKKLDELLTEMQNRRIHIAIVVDEYGGVAGLVTLEDIVEELVGEIQDEYDDAEEMMFQEMDNGAFLFRGGIDLDDFNEIMESHLSTNEADTLGGLIYSKIGRVPKGGEIVEADDILLTVEQVTGRRIRTVKAQRVLTENNINNE